MDAVVAKYFHSVIGRLPFFDGIAAFFASYVPYLFIIAFVCMLYVPGMFGGESLLMRKQNRLRFILMTALALLIASGIITPLIHYLYGRARPFAAFDWAPLFTHEADPSFPSRHATLLFTLAAALWQRKRSWGYWFFSLATVIGIARVYSLVHYPTDILAGAFIGIAVVYLVNRITRFS